MSLDLFRILEGLQIEDASGVNNSVTNGSHVSIIQGTSAPGGDSSQQDAAGIGSLYLRRDASGPDNLQLYYKWSTSSSAVDWKVIPSKEYVDALAQGLSWREPVKVLEPTLYTNIAVATAAANTTNTIGGIAISSGDRILFTNITSANKNVYIVGGSPGNWIFIEDVNLATDGDALMVKQGIYAETQWTYDGIQWTQFGSAVNNAEIEHIRSYIGKTGAGLEYPTFSSTNLIINSPNLGFDNLETAIGKIDTGLGNGNIINTGGNWSLPNDLAFVGTVGASGTLTITQALNSINVAIGDRVYTGTILTSGSTIAASIESLNVVTTELQNQNLVVVGSVSVTPNVLTTVASIPLAIADQVKWMVAQRTTASPSIRRSFVVDVITDGLTIDPSLSSILKLNGGVVGADFDVIINGLNLELRLKATNAYDYVVRRIAYSHF